MAPARIVVVSSGAVRQTDHDGSPLRRLVLILQLRHGTALGPHARESWRRENTLAGLLP
jgi:hypothetical protein